MLTVFEVLDDKELKGSFFFLLANFETLQALVGLTIWCTIDFLALFSSSQLAFTTLCVMNECGRVRTPKLELSNLYRLSIYFYPIFPSFWGLARSFYLAKGSS